MPLRDRHDGLDFAQYGLVELPSEERHGFVWVVLQRDHPIDVAAHLGELDAEIGSLGCDRMQYYSSIEDAPLAANWKSVAEGLLEGLHVPYVHVDTFNLNPQAVNVDLAFYDVIGPHVRWGLPMFDKVDAERLAATPEDEWNPGEAIGCIWLISPGLLLAHELYGIIYADLSPGFSVDEAHFRYGWLSPVTEAPDGMPSPEEMAAGGEGGRAGPARLGRVRPGSGTWRARLRADRPQREGRPALPRGARPPGRLQRPPLRLIRAADELLEHRGKLANVLIASGDVHDEPVDRVVPGAGHGRAVELEEDGSGQPAETLVAVDQGVPLDD